jgi:hypothetical protein
LGGAGGGGRAGGHSGVAVLTAGLLIRRSVRPAGGEASGGALRPGGARADDVESSAGRGAGGRVPQPEGPFIVEGAGLASGLWPTVTASVGGGGSTAA